MSTDTVNPDYSPIPAFLKTVKGALPESAESGLIYINSSSLIQLSMATGKNLPYLAAAQEFRVNDLCHAISSRGSYLEVACLSVATLVHNTVLALLYTAFVVVTFGQSENTNFNCRKHWTHILHSGMGVGIGLLGTFSPTLGMRLNVAVARGLYSTLKAGYQNDVKLFEADLVGQIKVFFNEYKDHFVKFAIENHPDLFYSEYDPFFRDVSRTINAAQNVADLMEAVLLAKAKVNREQPSASEDKGAISDESESLDMSKGDWSELYKFFSALETESWKKLPDATKSTLILLQSTSLTQLSNATFKNLPYVATADEFGVNDFSHFLSSRFNYLEAALVGFASFVYNVAMTALYTSLAVLSAGQSEGLNFGFKKHWSHLFHSACTVGIGLTGTLVPMLGAYFNYLIVRSYLHSLVSSYEKDLKLYQEQLLSGIKVIYKDYHEILVKFGQEWFDTHLRADFKPFIEYVDAKVGEAKNMEDLAQLAMELWRQFPRVHHPMDIRNANPDGTTKHTAMFQYYEPDKG